MQQVAQNFTENNDTTLDKRPQNTFVQPNYMGIPVYDQATVDYHTRNQTDPNTLRNTRQTNIWRNAG